MGFAEEFTRGLVMGREEQERKRRAAEMEAQRRAEQERMGRVDARSEALQNLQLAATQHAPEEALPEGQAGPPIQLPRQPIQVPSVVPGGQATQVMPRYLTDILAQKRAEEELQAERTRETARMADEAKRVALPPQLAAALGLAPGAYDPQVLSAATSMRNVDENAALRRQAAGDAAAARAEAKQEKASQLDQFVAPYIAGLQDRSVTAEQISSLPPALKGKVLAAAQEAGIRPLRKKQLEDLAGIEQLDSQAQAIAEQFTGAGVGPIDARLPTFRAKTAAFEATAQGLFNEIAKLRSGGAVTPQEYERLRAELPTLTDREPVFKAKLERLRGLLATKKKAIIGAEPAAAPAGNADPLGLGL